MLTKYTSKKRFHGIKLYMPRVARLNKSIYFPIVQKTLFLKTINIQYNPNIPKRNEESVILDIRLV